MNVETEKIENENAALNRDSEDLNSNPIQYMENDVKIEPQAADDEISLSDVGENAQNSENVLDNGLNGNRSDNEIEHQLHAFLVNASQNLKDGDFGISMNVLEQLKVEYGDELEKYPGLYVKYLNMAHYVALKLEHFEYAEAVAMELVKKFPITIGDPYVTLGHVANQCGDIIRAHTWISISVLFASYEGGFEYNKRENANKNLEMIESLLKIRLKN